MALILDTFYYYGKIEGYPLWNQTVNIGNCETSFLHEDENYSVLLPICVKVEKLTKTILLRREQDYYCCRLWYFTEKLLWPKVLRAFCVKIVERSIWKGVPKVNMILWVNTHCKFIPKCSSQRQIQTVNQHFHFNQLSRAAKKVQTAEFFHTCEKERVVDLRPVPPKYLTSVDWVQWALFDLKSSSSAF